MISLINGKRGLAPVHWSSNACSTISSNLSKKSFSSTPFANAFLGVCHSMAHKLGAFHHLPHGVANALMINIVLRFNAAEVPTKMGTFPQYHVLQHQCQMQMLNL